MTFREQQNATLERTAEKATKWIGSTSSLLVHTALFILSFVIPLVGIISFERMLLVLTTIVSLEAIYLSIFIQMSVNKNSQDIEIIQEDVEEIQEDIDEIQKDVDEVQEDIEQDQEIEKKESEVLAHIQEILISLKTEIEVLKKK